MRPTRLFPLWLPLLASLPASAQTAAPVAQFWMDAATSSASIPGMEGMGGLGGALMGGGFFGGTRASAPGKWLDTALVTARKPAGTEGTHAIPPGLALGASLPLLPVKAAAPERDAGGDAGNLEAPKGRLLFYWGCGETVRPGQPRILDFAKAGNADFARFMAGRHAPERGARAAPGRAIWPNERDRQRVPEHASLTGEHAVTGDGVPPGLRFALAGTHDFMPPVTLRASGDTRDSIALAWEPVSEARGYFLSAMGGRGEQDLIVWSSSEQADPGWGLMDYLAPARVARLIEEKVVLPPATRHCALPRGIFDGAEGAMVRLIAYGPELNLAHPPRPADPKAAWKPEWAVRVRLKSTGMTVLGLEAREGERGDRREEPAARPADAREEGGLLPGLPSPGSLIRGIFGR